ncbi:MAG TPA: aminoglycoside 6-adenylyltransferase [Ktedonobacterales bacterium]|nr:aminoglycoside 6-adenylyltransferase [Ktedonobacterales bacterium]
MASEADVLDRLIRWAEQHALIRALLLESSRANDQATLDRFSDYDVLVVADDLRSFAEDDTWLGDFGMPLATFRDTQQTQGMTTYMRLVLYADRTKVDYALWPTDLLRQVVARQELPDLLDWGYRVLVDKDTLTRGLPAPTHTAHIPPRPTEREYQALVEEFWWETIYVAKNLWRDELLHAKYNLEVVMKYELLLRMLEWRVEIDHNWSWKPGIVGRGMKKHAPVEIWAEVERTFVGPGLEENWQALFATTALFRRVATEVGNALGYTYPQELDQRVTAYLRETHDVPH